MNDLYPNLGEDDWLVRENIKVELNAKLPSIATFLLDNEIDYENDQDGLAEVITKHLDSIDFTHDEVEFVVTNIQIYTAIQELQRDGVIEMTEDGQYRTADPSPTTEDD